MVFLITYCVLMDRYEFIIPALSIPIGFIYTQTGMLLHYHESTIAGYWMILTGSIVLVFNSMSFIFSLPLTIGTGMTLLGIGLYIHPEPSTEK